MKTLQQNIKLKEKNYWLANKKGRIITDILMVSLIIGVFLFLAVRHLGYNIEPKPIRDNPRFVNVDEVELLTQVSALDLSNHTARQEGPNAKNVFVLTYHVVTKNTTQDEYDITYDQFKETMFALKANGYQTIRLAELYSYLKGEIELPDKSFVLTFDDGAKQAYYNADPVLKALNYSAVMFVITGHSLNQDHPSYYLNYTELIELRDTGRWELEAHTHKSHFRVPIDSQGRYGPALTNKIWIESEERLETDEEYLERVTYDLTLGKSILEDEFNLTVRGFALPFGDFGESSSNYPMAHRILENLTNDLFPMVFFQFKPDRDRSYRANYNIHNKDVYKVMRISADILRTPDKLLMEIEKSRAVDLPYFEDYSLPGRWIKLVGANYTFENESITISVETPTKGKDPTLMLYLDGSYLWKDYLYSLELRNSGASKVILLSRFVDPLNYAECRFSSGLVRIESLTNNVEERLVERRLSENQTLVAGRVLSMGVVGNKAYCFIDGQEVARADVPKMSPNGGIGVRSEVFATSDRVLSFGNLSVVGSVLEV